MVWLEAIWRALYRANEPKRNRFRITGLPPHIHLPLSPLPSPLSPLTFPSLPPSHPPLPLSSQGVAARPGRAGGIAMKMKRIEEEGGLRRRFRELLWFWREYYSHRGKDRASLEVGSASQDHQTSTASPRPSHIPHPTSHIPNPHPTSHTPHLLPHPAQFSSRIPYREWYKVLLLLTADDVSPTALLPAPIPLPDSPFERPAGDSTRQFVPS